MNFLFFDMADKILFARDDAESASWSVDQMSLQCTFPYKAEKEITRGMRVGFQYLDGWQVFEIRKCKDYEPEHYQEITAESIAISELTDEVYEGPDITNETAGQVLATILTGTLWQVGNNTASNTSSVDVGLSGTWNHVRNVEQNWNVIIMPRVTVGNSGITGRYLDISPNEGTWRGVRLSLEKNAGDVGVTWDDSEVKTALYGYGKQTNDVKLTFAEAVWTATADHPAKPEGQTYIEDPTAKALYGRNGRNRFGYYQNADIADPEILLQKTWESLQTVNTPRVTINALVRDLYRYGYADQPIWLHDKVVVELRPINKILVQDVIKLDIDLLDPSATRPTIGAYIPNIIYIDRETDVRASGGRGGGMGDTEREAQLKLMNTSISANGEAIALEAYQRAYEDGQLSSSLLDAWASINLKSTQISSLVTGSGVQLDSNGNLIVDQQGNPIFTTTGGGLYSRIVQEADRISLVVTGTGSNAAINTAGIILAINGGTGHSSAVIEADHIQLSGNTTLSGWLSISNGELVSDGPLSSTGYLKGTELRLAGTSTYTLTAAQLGNTVTELSLTPPASGSNNYTLKWKYIDGTTFTETFSRATLMSGTWDSGVLTVLPDAQGQARLDYYLSGGSVSWSGASGSIPILYSTTQSGATAQTGYTISVSRAGSISAASPQSSQPSGTLLRTVTVGTGGNHTYVRVSATGYRNANDYIQIDY